MTRAESAVRAGHDATQMRLEGLEGRVALVTGAAQGIGARLAEVLHALGAVTAAGDLVAPAHAGILGVELDVTDPACVERCFAAVEADLGVVEILVLNAGIFVVEPFELVSDESFRRTLDVNLVGAFTCARRAVPGMAARRYGRLVALGSSAGVTGGTRACAAYAASKAGLMTLVKAIANEYADRGITANALAPTLINTPMIRGSESLASRIPVGRLGEPDDVAAAAAFLCSAHAGYITGEILDVNGGWLVD